MQNKIYKYPLTHNHFQTISLPYGSVIRFVGHQNNVITLWAEVTEDLSMEPLPIYIFATGEEMEFKGGEPKYLNTVQLTNGTVWHVYTAF